MKVYLLFQQSHCDFTEIVSVMTSGGKILARKCCPFLSSLGKFEKSVFECSMIASKKPDHLASLVKVGNFFSIDSLKK
jgi:hypothetical protein